MQFNILKFNENTWVLIPPKNTVQEILDILQKTTMEDFVELLQANFIEDIDGLPDTISASKIALRYERAEEIDFELYEYL